MEDAIATQDNQGIAYRHELTVEELVLQVKKIHDVMGQVMRPGLEGHYGIIPGTKKPTLLKPGAELLCMLFRLAPEYRVQMERDGAHLNVESTCTLRHIPTGMVWATGMGLCSTRESKYAYRKSGKVCPECSKEDTVIKGKAEYGGGWLCFGKKGGCGAKFKDGDGAIESQQTEERVANPDIPDTENTVLKIGNKRSLIAAVLNATAASEVFTQDMEDFAAPASAEPTARVGQADPPSRGGDQTQPVTHRAGDAVLLISEQQFRKFWATAKTSGWDETSVHDKILTPRKLNHLKELPAVDFDEVFNLVKIAPPK